MALARRAVWMVGVVLLTAPALGVKSRIGLADGEGMPTGSDGELTPIELRAVRLLAIGQSTREIAWALGIADHEVRQLGESIRRKTGCTDPIDVWCAVSGCEP